MRLSLLFFILFLTDTKAVAQIQDVYPETYQPANIYKANNVKERIVRFDGQSSNSSIDLFDHNGLLIEHIDLLGGNYSRRVKFEYDSSQKLIGKTIYSYGTRFDTVSKRMMPTSYIDTSISKFEYDSLNRIVKEINKNSKRVQYETVFTFEPLMKVEKLFYDNAIEIVT